MSTVQATPAAPGYGELSRQVAALRPLIEGEADAAERERHMTDALYAAFAGAGLWQMMTPGVLGGSELPWSEGLAIAEQVAAIDGSTGWPCAIPTK